MDTKLRLPDLKTNLQKICRTCLIGKDNLQTIFRILDLLRECTSIQINMDDNLPKLICLDCTNKLNTAFKFRQQCEVSEKILLQLREFGETPEITVKLESNESNSLIQIENLETNEIYIKSENSYNTNENNFDEYNNNEFNDVHSTSVHSVFETSLSETKNMSDVSKTQNIRLENENVNLSKDYSPLNIILKAKNEESHEDNDSDISWQSSDESVTLRKSKRYTKSSKLKDVAELEITQNGLSCSKCEKPYVCSTCGKRFTDGRRLSAHMKYHLGVRSFVCTICSKSFIFKRELRIHMRIHTGEKPYLCMECGESFSQSYSLTKHKRKHTGERPYSCTECDQSFTLNKYLKTHMLSHTGEKPYICKICDASYTSSGSLIIHNRSHTGERPFSCNVCEKTFKSRKHLVQHKRTHNKIL